jgi:hypothetical protein
MLASMGVAMPMHMLQQHAVPVHRLDRTATTYIDFAAGWILWHHPGTAVCRQATAL